MANESDNPRRSLTLDQVIAEYLQQLDQDRGIPSEQWLDDYPEHANALHEFFQLNHFVTNWIDGSNDSSTNVDGETRTEHLQCPDTKRLVKSSVRIERGHSQLRFDRFQVIREIGRGGCGIVYEVEDPATNRRVALKTLRLGLLASEEDRMRFANETKAIARLDHPNIVPLYEIGHEHEHSFFTMKLMSGGRLADRCKEFRQPQRAAELVSKIAKAVQHAHDRGILHRDLKPSNILLNKNGDPFVCDFGLAKDSDSETQLTRVGAVVGTPAFMSPEQLDSNQSPTIATDVYGLGCLLYTALAGRPPFTGTDIADVIRNVQRTSPPRLRKIDESIPRDLEQICIRCLEKSPTERYRSAYEVAEELDNYLNHRPIKARPRSLFSRSALWFRRDPLTASLVTGLAVIGLVAGITVTALWLRAENLRLLADNRGTRLNEEVNNQIEANRKLKESSQQLQQKTLELTNAVDRLLIGIADSPEIELAGAEPLRRKLLSEAQTYYRSFVSERPKEPELRLEYARTLQKLSLIHSKLGDHQRAVELSKEAVNELDNLRSSVNDDSLQEKVADLSVVTYAGLAGQSSKLGHVEDGRRHAEHATQLAREAADRWDSANAQIRLATSLGELADVYSMMGLRSQCNRLALQAVEQWKQIDQSRELTTQQQFLKGRTFTLAARGLATSEDAATARPIADTAIRILEELVNESEYPSPQYLAAIVRTYQISGFLHVNAYKEAQADFARGIGYAEQLTRQHPLVPGYYSLGYSIQYNRALSHYFENDLELAESEFSQILDAIEDFKLRFPANQQTVVKTQADTLVMMGHTYGRQSRREKQLEVLIKSRDLNEIEYIRSGRQPARGELLSASEGSIGGCLSAIGRDDEAIEWFKKAIARLEQIVKEDPESGQATRFLSNNYFNVSNAYFDTGQNEFAYEFIKKAIDVYPHSTPPAEMYCGRKMRIEIRLEQTNDAEQSWQRFSSFLTTNPRNLRDKLHQCDRLLSELKNHKGKIESNWLDEHAVKVSSHGIELLKNFLAEPETGNSAQIPALLDKLENLKSNPRFKTWFDSIDQAQDANNHNG